jgi:heme-degrading monooxygenase HmoA
MTTIGMHYDVLPGKEEEFKKGFAGVLAYLRKVAGHLDSHLYEDVNGPGSYLILSEWQTKETFDAFIHSEQFKAVTNWGKAEILRGRPKHTVYQNQ